VSLPDLKRSWLNSFLPSFERPLVTAKAPAHLVRATLRGPFLGQDGVPSSSRPTVAPSRIAKPLVLFPSVREFQSLIFFFRREDTTPRSFSSFFPRVQEVVWLRTSFVFFSPPFFPCSFPDPKGYLRFPFTCKVFRFGCSRFPCGGLIFCPHFRDPLGPFSTFFFFSRALASDPTLFFPVFFFFSPLVQAGSLASARTGPTPFVFDRDWFACSSVFFLVGE